MRTLAALALLIAACTANDAPAQSQPQTQAEPPRQAYEAAPVPVVDPLNPDPPAESAPGSVALNCAGAMTQGGVALCRVDPGAEVLVDDVLMATGDENGWAVIGFARDAGPSARVVARRGGRSAQATFVIAPRTFDIQRVDGLPPQTVRPTDPEVLARIQREAALKQQGFASNVAMRGFLDGFIWPVEGPISGRWGNQRILNGVPATPHFGVDIAAPAGSPIRAPAAGVVSLANPDMHFEGGLVFIDHGQGLITMYLHMSRLDVAAGDRVEQGQVIGAVGSSGRATGPHLCWRMRLNGRQLDPSVAIEGLRTARAELLR